MTTTPDFETLIVSVEPAADTTNPHAGTLGRLTLNQPEKLNPVGLTPLRELAEAARWFDDAGASVVIVSGAGGRAFSSGFDLTEFADSNIPTGATGSGADLGRRMAEALEGMNALAIAQIQGHCVGGGLVLAAACDLRIAADDAKFSIPEVDLGIPLAWGGIPRMVREIGPAMTKELVLTCRPFTSQEAHAVGFLNRVVPLDALVTEVEDLAQSLLAKAPSLIRTTKRQVRDAAENMASTTTGWVGDATIAEALASEDARSAARQYLKSKNK